MAKREMPTQEVVKEEKIEKPKEVAKDTKPKKNTKVAKGY